MPPRLSAVATMLVLAATPAAAQPADLLGGREYATVRGWTVMQNDAGCAAFQSQLPVVFHTPPAGGWQLIFPYNVPEDAGEFAGFVDVDRFSFGETYYDDGTWMYSEFPLSMRQTVGKGKRKRAEIGPMIWEVDLTGSTAALLKLEECWQDLSGWTPASSRAGTFAFSGD